MRYHSAKFPSINDVVFVKVTSISDNNTVYVELLEYDLLQGMILPTEINKKSINPNKIFVIETKVYPVVVMNVDIIKKHIDLSYKRIPENLKLSLDTKYMYYKKLSNMVQDIYDLYKKYISNKSVDLDLDLDNEIILKNVMWPIFNKISKNEITAENLYNNLLEDPSSIFKLDDYIVVKLDDNDQLPAEFIDNVLTNMATRIKTNDVTVSAEINLTVTTGNAISLIKQILNECLTLGNKLTSAEVIDKVMIEYVSSPKYRLVATDKSYDAAKELINKCIENIKKNPIKKNFYFDEKITIVKNKKYQLVPL